MTSTKCRINTVVSPGDGHIVARNMYRLIDIIRINGAPSWFYLQENIKTKQKHVHFVVFFIHARH